MTVIKPVGLWASDVSFPRNPPLMRTSFVEVKTSGLALSV
jgi:hypothetical protein